MTTLVSRIDESPHRYKMSTRKTPTARRNAGGRLDLLHVTNTSIRYRPCETVFAQGDRCAAVMYIRKGRVKLTVTSRAGREAVVATLHAGAFFGEAALAGQRRRTCTAESVTASTIAMVKTTDMRRALQQDVALADRFRALALARNIRAEADLIAELFNRCEKRLAQVLLLLTKFDEHQLPRAALPLISRDLLAETIGIPRWKVDRLMNSFRKRGFLERYSERDGGVQVHRSMLSVVLQD